jgi:hypothetical protein
MSIAVKLQSAVDRAFTTISDLVYKGELIPKAQGGYDWNENTVVGSRPKRTPIDVIFYEESRSLDRSDAAGGGSNTIEYKAVVKSIEFNNGLYDRIIIEGDEYDIESFKDSLVVTELTLTRVAR